MLKPSRVHLLAAPLLGGILFAGCSSAGDKLTLGSNHAPLLAADAADVIEGEFVVKFKDSTPKATIDSVREQIAQRADSSIEYAYSEFPGFAAKLSVAALQDLLQNADMAYIEANRKIDINTVYEPEPDGLDRVDQRTLPRDGLYDDHGQDGAGVNVYIVDTGIRSTHVEFTGRMGSMADFVGDGRNGEDCHGHGTHVASTAAGTQYGLAKAATLHAVRVLSCSGSGSYAGVIAGVDHVRTDCATRSGPCVANMSLGGPRSEALNDAIEQAVASGVVFAVAAGNESTDACNKSPAGAPSALTVGSVDDDDDVSYFSNVGVCVDIFAPGRSILGADADSDTDTMIISGTSMASPHVAGAVAQYLGANPDATPADVAAALEYSATPGCVAGLDMFTTNKLLFNDFSRPGAGQGCAAATCEGFCGRQAAGGCYCDSQCDEFGDCCPDKVDICGKN